MFEVGDKAICDINDVKVEIQFGPIIAPFGKESYLVKWLEGSNEGCSSIVWACDLKALPKFEVGQTVRYSELLHKVVAGPFTRHTGSRFWVLEAPDGSQDMEYEKYISPVVE